MNRKKLVPYFLISLVLLLFVLAELLIPKPLDWTVTLASEDKKPYGAYGLSKALEDLFPEQQIYHANFTLYEADTLPESFNFLILAEQFNPDPQDTRVLLDKVGKGATALISAGTFRGLFADTLQLATGNLLFESIQNERFNEGEGDSISIRFTQPSLPKEPFKYTLAAAPAYFDSLPAYHQVLARNQENEPVLVKITWGKGAFFLSSTPLAFSNYYLLEGPNHHFIETALSYLPVSPLLWTEYYQLGRMEPQTPLRFILSDAALRWAYYFGMSILLVFVLFGLKRRQRPIPTLSPPENTSLQFAASLGTLYFQQADHLNLARKKIVYLNEYIRSHYRLTTAWHDPEFVHHLAQKSNKPKESIQHLASLIQQAETSREFSAQKLLELNKAVNLFYYSQAPKLSKNALDSRLTTHHKAE